MAFLVFEGMDASGKSTLLNLLCNQLQEQGVNFVKTKEPGGTKSGETIREILLAKENISLDPLVETLLYYADRKQHIEELIKPSLKKGTLVLSDRYWASTSAYQCGGRGVDESFVSSLHQNLCQTCEPNLWILLDLPIEESFNRLVLKRKDRDRIEMEDRAFHQRVRDYYLQLANKEPSRWLILSALQKPEQLLDQLVLHLKKKGFYK